VKVKNKAEFILTMGVRRFSTFSSLMDTRSLIQLEPMGLDLLKNFFETWESKSKASRLLQRLVSGLLVGVEVITVERIEAHYLLLFLFSSASQVHVFQVFQKDGRSIPTEERTRLMELQSLSRIL